MSALKRGPQTQMQPAARRLMEEREAGRNRTPFNSDTAAGIYLHVRPGVPWTSQTGLSKGSQKLRVFWDNFPF